MATSVRVLALVGLFIANYNNVRDANEEEDRQVKIKEEYDFVVVGAGTTGSVVAARLAQLGQSVLVVEAGQSGRGDVNIDVPYFVHNLEGSDKDWHFKMPPHRRLDHTRPTHYRSGKVGGGSSAVNYNVYIRGSEHDYKLWEDEGATGWNLDNLKKYFAKVENATEKGMSESLGKSGAIKLSRPYYLPLVDIINNAANEIGIPTVDYLDGGGLKPGVSKYTASIANGKKQYAFNSYLYPEMSKINSTLDVAFEAYAHKILFRDVNGEMEAYGLQFNHSGVMKTVKSRKEIIVSAGFANSPKLLMLSGIGPKRHLRKFGIEAISDVPGVGSNGDGHVAMRVRYYGDKLPKAAALFSDKILESFTEYERTGNGPISTSVLLTNMINIQSKYSGTKYVLGSEKYPFPDMNIHVTGSSHTVDSLPDNYNIYTNTYNNATKHRNGTLYHFGFAVALSHSLSKGTVRLQSSDPNDPPIYNPNYFANRGDFKVMKEVMRWAESMESSKEFQKYGLRLAMIPDVCLQFDKGVPRGSQFYRCYVKQLAANFLHSTSTCKIGFKNDTMSVLDSRLRLHTVNKVRVADASVFPHVTSANPQATCYVVGEKAADMIREDWNL